MKLEAAVLCSLMPVLALGCGRGPEVWWSSAGVPSPEKEWVAQTKEIGYDRGLFTEFGREVQLRRAGASSAKTVLVLDGDWRQVGAGDDSVRLRWAENRVLEVAVPNRTVYYERLSEYEGIVVRLVYRNDDPMDRREWIRKRLARSLR